MLTFESLQSLLTELSALLQFFVAILGLIAILLPFVQKALNESSLILPSFITSFLYKLFLQLGIPQLILYIRPQEYYDNLSKELISSELVTNCKAADICLNSNIEADDDSALVSGLVNTGNSCFLNSVLQAMSSLPSLHVYLEKVNQSSNGVPLPVTRTLLKTIRSLTKPLLKRSSFRPVDVVTALSSNRRIISREQQDAQEFFQLVSSAIDTEGQIMTRSEFLGQGLKDLLKTSNQSNWISRTQTSKYCYRNEHVENPFMGLLANRLSCMHCGYTGAIRHFSFNNIQLIVPNKYTATLESCLAQFTSMEYLQDASCRRCSFENTINSLTTEIQVLKQQQSKKHKNKRDIVVQSVALEKAKRELEHALKNGRIEEDQPFLKSTSRMSTKQVMLAKPPKILCLHISRSAFLNTGAVYKNTCQILFPEYLDISPFSTNGTLSTQPNQPISSNMEKSKCIYRLMSVVVHYGSHSFGHFVAFKRRIYTDCKCHACQHSSNKEDWQCQDAWYRISDSKVDECSLEDVLRANPYMLLYELIDTEQEEEEQEEEDEEEKEEIVEQDQAYSYAHIPTDDATREALRIANSLMMGDDVLLLAK